MELDALPDNVLRGILLSLLPSVPEILRLSSGRKAWRTFAFGDVELWKGVCEAYFVEKALPELNETDDEDTVLAAKSRWCREAFTTFGVLNTSYKGYLDDYRREFPVYQRLRQYLAQSSPRTLLTLQPGIPLRRLRSPDQAVRGTALYFGAISRQEDPNVRAFVLWYSFFNGQSWNGVFDQRPYGLFGAHDMEGVVGGQEEGGRGNLQVLMASSQRLPATGTFRTPSIIPFANSIVSVGLDSGTMFQWAFVVDTPVNFRHLLHQVVYLETNEQNAYSGRFIASGTFSQWIFQLRDRSRKRTVFNYAARGDLAVS
jgi:hypothetical protein